MRSTQGCWQINFRLKIFRASEVAVLGPKCKQRGHGFSGGFRKCVQRCKPHSELQQLLIFIVAAICVHPFTQMDCMLVMSSCFISINYHRSYQCVCHLCYNPSFVLLFPIVPESHDEDPRAMHHIPFHQRTSCNTISHCKHQK